MTRPLTELESLVLAKMGTYTDMEVQVLQAMKPNEQFVLLDDEILAGFRQALGGE